jgi:hypothetical protein
MDIVELVGFDRTDEKILNKIQDTYGRVEPLDKYLHFDGEKHIDIRHLYTDELIELYWFYQELFKKYNYKDSLFNGRKFKNQLCKTKGYRYIERIYNKNGKIKY